MGDIVTYDGKTGNEIDRQVGVIPEKPKQQPTTKDDMLKMVAQKLGIDTSQVVQ